MTVIVSGGEGGAANVSVQCHVSESNHVRTTSGIIETEFTLSDHEWSHCINMD